MTRLNVNPTRMELQKLKMRLKSAKRGYKLLKDKSDEQVRQFMIYIKENITLRSSVETDISTALRTFVLTRARTSDREINQALSMPSLNYNIEYGFTNIMGLNVPKIETGEVSLEEVLPYSLISGTSRLDKSIMTLNNNLSKIIRLAEVEKICMMLAEDIEKNRRRINALEFVLIPQIEETIRYIIMKLEEYDRNNRVRLMKVKQLIENSK